MHWIAAEPGVYFGPHVRLGAGSAPAASSNGTFAIGTNSSTYANPPVLVMSVLREGGNTTATHVRNISEYFTKVTATYEAYTDTASGIPFKVSWIAVDTH